MKKNKVQVAKGVKIPKKKEAKLKKKPGGSNTGKYKNVPKKDFAGSAGGTSPYSFPIPNINKARSALKLAHNAPDPEGIKRKVYAKFPELRPGKKKKRAKK